MENEKISKDFCDRNKTPVAQFEFQGHVENEKISEAF